MLPVATRTPQHPHYALAALSAGAAAIHFALAPAHFAESTALGAGFVVAAWFQLALAVVLVVRPSRAALAAGAVGNTVVLGVWLLSRTLGVWFINGGEPEAAAFVDMTAAALEAALVLGAVAVLSGYRVPGRSGLRPAGVMVVAGALALASVALASPGAEHEHDVGVDHSNEVALAATDDGHDHELGTEVGETAAADAGGAVPAGGAHHHDACAAPVTPEQQAVADEFIAASDATVARYTDFAVAQAEGWQPITPENTSLVHYALMDRLQDGLVLDPTAPESLIYAFGANRTPYFVGAMYLMEGTGDPPQPGGCAMTWHNHENLCIAPGRGMVGVLQADGSCPEGSENVATTYMLHAWSIPMPGGPFSEIDPQAVRQAVIDAYT
jgi:hypothetical protein